MPSKATTKYNLQISNPTLAKEWHPTKNGSLTPIDVTFSSHEKVWWLCSRGHAWETKVNTRSSMKCGCPYCSGRQATDESCLQTVNPTLAKEWHPTKNYRLTPNDVTRSSSKKVWWKCTRGHEWNAVISGRSKGGGCPYCSGHKVNDENCLQTLNPSLTKEWHSEKNGNLKPRDVTASSHKKVWWQCLKGHEWEATVNDRSNKHGCPYCNKQKRWTSANQETLPLSYEK